MNLLNFLSCLLPPSLVDGSYDSEGHGCKSRPPLISVNDFCRNPEAVLRQTLGSMLHFQTRMKQKSSRINLGLADLLNVTSNVV